MNIKKHLCGLLLALACLSPLPAAGDAVKTLPPLTIESTFPLEVDKFAKSAVTIDLFKRYEFIARSIDGGADFEASIKRLREYQKADSSHWAGLATQEFREPKKPKEPQKGDSNAKKAYGVARKAYEKKRAEALLRFEKQKAIITAYSSWLSDDVLPWINGLKPVMKTTPAK